MDAHFENLVGLFDLSFISRHADPSGKLNLHPSRGSWYQSGRLLLCWGLLSSFVLSEMTKPPVIS